MYLHEIKKKAAEDGIILTSQETSHHRYITHTKQMLIEYDWDYFITLTFAHTVTCSQRASQAVHHFINKLSKKAYGGRSKKRIGCFSVIEKADDDSLHVHMLLQDPNNNISNAKRKKDFHLRDAIITAWLQASSATGNPALSSLGDEWMKRVYDVREVVGYMLKHYRPQLDGATTIVWEEASLDGRKIA